MLACRSLFRNLCRADRLLKFTNTYVKWNPVNHFQDCMRGSLAKARVIYAPVEEIGAENRLLRACQVIIDTFTDAGLVLDKDAKTELKLHATLMNARHRKRKGKSKMKKSDSFDARGIFRQFGSENWGEYLIREAHLSQRFKFDENGSYHCCASIPFPENMQVD